VPLIVVAGKEYGTEVFDIIGLSGGILLYVLRNLIKN
jgi:hypothetical protein